MIIYNDYKNEDWLKHTGGLPSNSIIIINNQEYSFEVVGHLSEFDYSIFYSAKLVEGTNGRLYRALDAENYGGELNYSDIADAHAFVMFPEDLGGDKYARYDEFIFRVKPAIICMERTYNVWKPWELLKFWNRNKYLRDNGISTYMGIWPESLPFVCQKIQLFFAKWISGNKLFWYSETKSLPT